MKRVAALAGVAAAIAFLLFAIDHYRHRFVRTNAGIIRLLPPGRQTQIYVDLDALRQAQLLGVLANVKVASDGDYDAFLARTGFDYTRDLKSAAISFDGGQTFLIGRGTFQWDKLAEFATSRGGSCQESSCRLAGSTPGRWVHFLRVQPDVLAVTVSANEMAGDDLRVPLGNSQETQIHSAVWAKLSPDLLKNPTALPVPMRILAISLQSAEAVTIEAAAQNITLIARFANSAAADTARRQLEMQTKALNDALLKEGQRPDHATVAGLLAGGTFQAAGNVVRGAWPLYPELLRALQ